jgi:hypothetical protein
MFIAALFTIVKLWNQLRYSTINEWIKKYGAHIPSGVSSSKNETMSFAGKWMELGIIMSNEISQAYKDKYVQYWFPLILGI